jgi:hypothetical protein
MKGQNDMTPTEKRRNDIPWDVNEIRETICTISEPLAYLLEIAADDDAIVQGTAAWELLQAVDKVRTQLSRLS